MSNCYPLVSVIIPIYNVEKYISECLDSIINQTYKNLEIILVDDGSPDSSGKMCDKYASSDLRIKVIHKENGGVSTARNAGIEISTGEWIYFIDPDDIAEKDLIDHALKTALADGTDMCFFDFKKKYGDTLIKVNSLKSNKNVFNDMQNIETLIAYFSGGGYIWNFIIRSESIRGKIKFDETINYAEDELFKFQLYSQIQSFSYINEELYYYRILSTSAVGNIFNRTDYADISYYLYKIMNETILAENYPDNAYIIPNSRLIRRLNTVVKIAFNNQNSIKCNYDIIKRYTETNEYKKACLNYDKRLIGIAGNFYVLFKKPGRFVITVVYFLTKFYYCIMGRKR